MSPSSLQSLRIRAKLLQKSKNKSGKPIALKEAFAILAKSAGYSSWKEMKDMYYLGDILNPPHWSAQWKTWFSTKAEALRYTESNGGYLIPYLKQYFVCDRNYLQALGLDENDKDLLKVGRDWSEPQDESAWYNLVQKIKDWHQSSMKT